MSKIKNPGTLDFDPRAQVSWFVGVGQQMNKSISVLCFSSGNPQPSTLNPRPSNPNPCAESFLNLRLKIRALFVIVSTSLLGACISLGAACRFLCRWDKKAGGKVRGRREGREWEGVGGESCQNVNIFPFK